MGHWWRLHEPMGWNLCCLSLVVEDDSSSVWYSSQFGELCLSISTLNLDYFPWYTYFPKPFIQSYNQTFCLRCFNFSKMILLFMYSVMANITLHNMLLCLSQIIKKMERHAIVQRIFIIHIKIRTKTVSHLSNWFATQANCILHVFLFHSASNLSSDFH